jgi:pyrroloquinoline quinone (PQQ) biosynthesis protein C
VLADRQLLVPPFYSRWEAGQLSRGVLTHYAEQYRHFEMMLPEFLTQLSQQLPEGPARDFVLDNLSDEVTAPSHLDRFDRFAQSLDAADAPISPATSYLVESYKGLLEQGPAASLAGLWAHESQGAKITLTKAVGLGKHYEIVGVAAEFWRVHGVVEGDHAQLSTLQPRGDRCRTDQKERSQKRQR